MTYIIVLNKPAPECYLNPECAVDFTLSCADVVKAFMETLKEEKCRYRCIETVRHLICRIECPRYDWLDDFRLHFSIVPPDL